jgi:lipoate-protein ligase A
MAADLPLAFWDGRVTAQANVARDDELLRVGVVSVRAALLSDRSVSVGVAQRPPDPVFALASTRQLPVVRRSTGGTGVLHLPGDVVWSVVLPRGHPLVGSDFTCAYPRLGQGVIDALAEFGVRSTWSPPFALSDHFCLLGPRGNVLNAEGRALGGAAQHVTRDALLHQGMVAGTIERSLLGGLFDLAPDLLEHRTTALAELAPAVSTERLAMRVLEHLERVVRESGPGGGR